MTAQQPTGPSAGTVLQPGPIGDEVMSQHPFLFDYVGLGLLDEESIRQDGTAWSAEYRIAGEPYLQVLVAPGRVRISEFDNGDRVALTSATSLTQAIGMHGSSALEGDISRFWERVGRTAGRVWVQLSSPTARYSYVPAIGIGVLCIPMPLDVQWREPELGPLARRLSAPPFGVDRSVSDATLVRFVAGEAKPREERVRLHKASVLGILAAEAVEAYFAANGPLRSIEWRPFLLAEPVYPVSWGWQAPRAAVLADGAVQEGFSIIEGGTLLTWLSPDRRN